eukprot:TRINITY_DN3701_c0_g2_i1.p1 TRINITY_DN3701_c0_g2~~TRINITY_DN3701_c0_g2_i1.p1  ORF type:complete len:365 (-),score=54.24 TRINITY_DN3701_c0_g2_i1:14-1030(-)
MNDDCIREIITWLDHNDLAILAQTNKRFKAFCTSDVVWKRQCEKQDYTPMEGKDWFQSYVHWYQESKNPSPEVEVNPVVPPNKGRRGVISTLIFLEVLATILLIITWLRYRSFSIWWIFAPIDVVIGLTVLAVLAAAIAVCIDSREAMSVMLGMSAVVAPTVPVLVFNVLLCLRVDGNTNIYYMAIFSPIYLVLIIPLIVFAIIVCTSVLQKSPATHIVAWSCGGLMVASALAFFLVLGMRIDNFTDGSYWLIFFPNWVCCLTGMISFIAAALHFRREKGTCRLMSLVVLLFGLMTIFSVLLVLRIEGTLIDWWLVFSPLLVGTLTAYVYSIWAISIL